ncbi:hypothetical protein M6B38_233920 [Iris pallida]|uniref:Uncharacterized protein n=1 Tax=Iris pallida TaxID=29817 RepID=A0AAX6DPY1_IRIPA|nr:hypothetical protein M6B38_233920 [Iris pallida]
MASRGDAVCGGLDPTVMSADVAALAPKEWSSTGSRDWWLEFGGTGTKLCPDLLAMAGASRRR